MLPLKGNIFTDSPQEVIHMDNTQQSVQIPQEIRTFLEGLLRDAGMTTLDDQMRDEMIKELFARLDNHITATIVDNLPDEHIEEFISMNEQKKPSEEINKFIQDKMPNAQEVFSKAFMDFRDLYLGHVTVARNAPSSTPDAPSGNVTPAPVANQKGDESNSQVN